jgi:hypothetical protein
MVRCPAKARASGKMNGGGDYSMEGGARPREVLVGETVASNLTRRRISSTAEPTLADGLGMIPKAQCALDPMVEAPTWGTLVARRHAFRLPEAASTTRISGCRSSVREMTGNRSATKHTMATASILLLCLGFCRDTVQRNRHSQITARVTASQTRLRRVSMDSCYCSSRRSGCYGPRPAGDHTFAPG